jgi:hypothetical protein
MKITFEKDKINSDKRTAADLAEPDGRGSLLYHNSNNTDTPSKNNLELLTPYHRKQAYSLNENVERFIEMFGLECVGFLTLTFKDNVTDHKEAYRRFGNLRKQFLSKAFPDYMLVKERQQRGAWHYHLLVGLNEDIRTGFKFSEVFPPAGTRPRYTSVNPYLRTLWKEIRTAMEKYGFGRSELSPIRKTGPQIAAYIGKYIEQNVIGKKLSGFEEQDKGVRLISYSRNWPRTSSKFSWNTQGGKEWRRKVALFAEYAKIKDMDGLSQKLSPKWSYFYADVIQDMDHITESIKQRKGREGANYHLSDEGMLLSGKTGEILF